MENLENTTLTRPQCIQVHRGTLQSGAGRWHRWGTGTPTGSLCRRSWGHRSPRSASPDTHQCRRRLQWLGCIWPRCGTDSGWCSGDPRSQSRSLHGEEREQFNMWFNRRIRMSREVWGWGGFMDVWKWSNPCESVSVWQRRGEWGEMRSAEIRRVQDPY